MGNKKINLSPDEENQVSIGSTHRPVFVDIKGPLPSFSETYFRILKRYNRPVALFFNRTYDFSRPLHAMAFDLEIYSLLAFCGFFVDLHGNQVHTAVGVVAVFAWARFVALFISLLKMRDGICNLCKNIFTGFFMLGLSIVFHLALFGFTLVASSDDYEKFQEVAAASVCFEFALWDFALMPAMIIGICQINPRFRDYFKI